jgi:hypothetical protein
MVGVQMRAHNKIDVVHTESARREVLLVAIGIHHVPEAPRRSRLVVAHAAIDHDSVVRCLHYVALDTEHQLIGGIEEPGLQPASVLVEKLSGNGREKFHRLEEWALLLDNAVDRGGTNFDSGGQNGLLLPVNLASHGLRLIDIADPRRPRDVSHFLPDVPQARSASTVTTSPQTSPVCLICSTGCAG